jgi:hypothetical protein
MLPSVTLMVTIDTEEDNWTPAREHISLENIREAPRLHMFLRSLGVRPTYFTSYHVAACPWAAEIVREFGADGAEVAAHLHPWNTPPLDETFTPSNTMLVNLPVALQRTKIATLTHTWAEAFGVSPRVFRTGRCAFGPSVASALIDAGYIIDSSVTPYINWRRFDDGPDHVGAPVAMYRVDGDRDSRQHVTNGPLVEVPVSVGYTGRNWDARARMDCRIDTNLMRTLRVYGLASRFGVTRRVMLSPETDSVADQVALTRRLIEMNIRHLNLVLHTPTLVPGLSPFAPTQTDVERIYASLEIYVAELSKLAHVTFATVSEAVRDAFPDVAPAADDRARTGRTDEQSGPGDAHHQMPDDRAANQRNSVTVRQRHSGKGAEQRRAQRARVAHEIAEEREERDSFEHEEHAENGRWEEPRKRLRVAGEQQT